MADELLLPQNWGRQEKLNWYELSQGSRLMPLAWLQALEQPGSTARILDDAFVIRFGYLPRDTSDARHLPLGFAIDTSDDSRFTWTKLRWKPEQSSREPWIGLTCSACHSNELHYQGHVLQIDGAPATADFQGFLEAIVTALKETRADPVKWQRFATRVLGPAAEPAALDELGTAFDQLARTQSDLLQMNATPLRYGPGRLDAFGHIFNKVAYVNGSGVASANPSDAPVKYPVLWNVPQHKWVQWNGVAENVRFPIAGLDFGALGRNAGEVIGVFGELTVVKDTGFLGLDGYASSLNIANLATFERQLQKLLPPAWPAVFPPIDAQAADRGRALYVEKCAGCHQVLARTDLTTSIPLKMGPLKPTDREPAVGTDPWMACNAFTYTAPSGALEGQHIGYLQIQLRQLQPVDSLAPMLATAVGGALIAQRQEIYGALATALADPAQPPSFRLEPLILPDPANSKPTEAKPARLQRCLSEASQILGYKARPLNGIWAAPPYLHNGSVPTLYDLLLPESQRPKRFYLGARDYDPVRAGIVTAPGEANRFAFETEDAAGRPIDGNSNRGHDYNNAALSEGDRKDLVEYLKSM